MVVVLTHLGLMLGNEFEEKKVFYEEDEIFGGREMFNFFFFGTMRRGRGEDMNAYHSGVFGRDTLLTITTTMMGLMGSFLIPWIKITN